MNYSLHALIFAVTGGALGQLLMKAGLQGLHTDTFDNFLQSVAASTTSSLILVCGLSLYVAAVPAWIIALKRFELSYAYPLLSLGYLIVYIGAFYWPGMEESINWQKTFGLSLIVVGVAITAQTSTPAELRLKQ